MCGVQGHHDVGHNGGSLTPVGNRINLEQESFQVNGSGEH